MRLLVAALLCSAAVLARAEPPKRVDFAKDVRPILENKCRPCHFTGGVVFTRMPFDRQETVIALGEKKMFTRINDESERAILRTFFAQQPSRPKPSP